MNSLTDETLKNIDPVDELFKQAAATAYCRPALKTLGFRLPADDAILTAALNKAAEESNAKAFTNLYVAVLYAGRRVGAEVIEVGAALLPSDITLATALHLGGDAAGSLAVAVRSGRLTDEGNAVALVAGWRDYKYRGVSAPPEFLALTRKICRNAKRVGMTEFTLSCLYASAALSGDPVLAKILNPIKLRRWTPEKLSDLVSKSVTNPGWDNSIPERPVEKLTSAGGASLKRVTSKAGRNAPCPCGSGKKFKHCCDGNASVDHQYKIHGVTVTDATAHPELVLTEERIKTMLYPELYALDPKILAPDLAVKVAFELARFHEFSRAIEALQAAGPEAVSNISLDGIVGKCIEARDIEALRWFVNWAPGSVSPWFETEFLLATPEDRLQLLFRKALDAFEAEQSGDVSAAQLRFNELGSAALLTDPAFGIVLARGALPVCGPVHQNVLIRHIEEARDILGLDDNEPGHGIVDAAARATIVEARHAKDIENVRAEMTSKVANRDAEIRRLKAEILSLRETLAKREQAIEKAKVTCKKQAVALTSSESAELIELRDKNRRLKGNLKAEHENHDCTKQELEAARDELRRANEILESQKPEEPANYEQDDEDTDSIGLEPGWHPLRKPEYGAKFLDSVWLSPATAYTLAGRLAAGDPSSWINVCALKSRPGTLRAKAGDCRLIFEIRPGDILHCVDFILRRDLETRLKNGR